MGRWSWRSTVWGGHARAMGRASIVKGGIPSEVTIRLLERVDRVDRVDCRHAPYRRRICISAHGGVGMWPITKLGRRRHGLDGRRSIPQPIRHCRCVGRYPLDPIIRTAAARIAPCTGAGPPGVFHRDGRCRVPPRVIERCSILCQPGIGIWRRDQITSECGLPPVGEVRGGGWSSDGKGVGLGELVVRHRAGQAGWGGDRGG